ncbi:MAG: hypothetical protein ACLRMZ_00515 [Blautia marasmi]
MIKKMTLIKTLKSISSCMKARWNVTEDDGSQNAVYVWKENKNGGAVEKRMELSWAQTPELYIKKSYRDMDIQHGRGDKEKTL